jgi:hypothetical protein
MADSCTARRLTQNSRNEWARQNLERPVPSFWRRETKERAVPSFFFIQLYRGPTEWELSLAEKRGSKRSAWIRSCAFAGILRDEVKLPLANRYTKAQRESEMDKFVMAHDVWCNKMDELKKGEKPPLQEINIREAKMPEEAMRLYFVNLQRAISHDFEVRGVSELVLLGRTLVIELQPFLPRRPRHADIFDRCCCSDALRNQLAYLVDAIAISASTTLAPLRFTSLKAGRQLLDFTMPISKRKNISLLTCKLDQLSFAYL